jgi:hypothetical protein
MIVLEHPLRTIVGTGEETATTAMTNLRLEPLTLRNALTKKNVSCQEATLFQKRCTLLSKSHPVPGDSQSPVLCSKLYNKKKKKRPRPRLLHTVGKGLTFRQRLTVGLMDRFDSVFRESVHDT